MNSSTAAPRRKKDKPKVSRAERKPYHISRKDLDLDNFRLDEQNKSFTFFLGRLYTHIVTSWQFWLYFVLQVAAGLYGYGGPFLCVGLLWMMVVNTGKRKDGEMSAYSIFNEGVEAIAGSTNMEALEQELRHRTI